MRRFGARNTRVISWESCTARLIARGVARIRVSKEPNRGQVRGTDEPCLIQRKAILSLGSLSQCHPLSPYRLFAFSAVSWQLALFGNVISLLKAKKKNSPSGPDGVTKGDHCHSQLSENDTPPPHLLPSFCIRMRCFRQRARIFALQGPLMLASTSLTPAPPTMPIRSQRNSDAEWGFLDHDHDARSWKGLNGRSCQSNSSRVCEPAGAPSRAGRPGHWYCSNSPSIYEFSLSVARAMTLSCHSLGFAPAVLFNLNTTISGSKDRGQFPSLIRLKELYHALATSPVFCFTLSGVRFQPRFLLPLFSQMQLSLWTRGTKNLTY